MHKESGGWDTENVRKLVETSQQAPLRLLRQMAYWRQSGGALVSPRVCEGSNPESLEVGGPGAPATGHQDPHFFHRTSVSI